MLFLFYPFFFFLFIPYMKSDKLKDYSFQLQSWQIFICSFYFVLSCDGSHYRICQHLWNAGKEKYFCSFCVITTILIAVISKLPFVVQHHFNLLFLTFMCFYPLSANVLACEKCMELVLLLSSAVMVMKFLCKFSYSFLVLPLSKLKGRLKEYKINVSSIPLVYIFSGFHQSTAICCLQFWVRNTVLLKNYGLVP